MIILAVNKQSAHGFDVERHNLKKLNGMDGRKEYQTEIINRTAA